MQLHRHPRQLWIEAFKWIKEMGWGTRKEDEVIADAVYAGWVAATNADSSTIHYRDRGKLMDALERAFRPIRDDRAADALIVIYLWLFELRGRREGILQRQRSN